MKLDYGWSLMTRAREKCRDTRWKYPEYYYSRDAERNDAIQFQIGYQDACHQHRPSLFPRLGNRVVVP